MGEKLEEALTRFQINNESSRKLFTDKAVIKEIPKNQIIFSEGKKCDFEYFLLDGVLHRYNLSNKGYNVTTWFYMAPEIITPHLARTCNNASIFSLETLTDSVLAEIPVSEFNHLRKTNTDFQLLGKNNIEAELTRIFYSEMVYRSYSAKKKLIYLRKTFPNLENLVPLTFIASFLGITNVSFSRLRSGLANGKFAKKTGKNFL
jgi:CRP-like cAMP-binding protein